MFRVFQKVMIKMVRVWWLCCPLWANCLNSTKPTIWIQNWTQFLHWLLWEATIITAANNLLKNWLKNNVVLEIFGFCKLIILADGDRILLVISLESLLGGDDEQLYAHISKTLQEKTAPYNFLRRMKHFMTPEKERKVVTKNDIDPDKYSWEHEPYFQNRISSLTLSHFPTADHVSRFVKANLMFFVKNLWDFKTTEFDIRSFDK